jgi:hypothetical protein
MCQPSLESCLERVDIAEAYQLTWKASCCE